MNFTFYRKRPGCARVQWWAGVVYCLLGWLVWELGEVPVFAAEGSPKRIEALEVAGKVEWLSAGTLEWKPLRVPQFLQPGDRIRTGDNSRATVRLGDSTVTALGPNGEYQFQELPDPDRGMIFRMLRGLMYLFHRGEPLEIEVQSGTSSAAIRGTEFVFQVTDTGRNILSLIEGEVEFRNANGSVRLSGREQGIADPDALPRKSPLVDAVQVIQWRLYYPGVLDVDELEFDQNQEEDLRPSLDAYRQGDLLEALARFPENRLLVTPDERLYRSALLLTVGQVTEAERQLTQLDAANPDARGGRIRRLARALRGVIEAVKGESMEPLSSAEAGEDADRLASELLSLSYQYQSLSDLPNALRSARRAVAQSPGFGFGWARVAELEFSFGRSRRAQVALEKSLSLAPHNAQAMVVQGFLFSARNKLDQALGAFDRAIVLDGALGNAWLGRGLIQIRKGRLEAGRGDLQVAAALEPRRALLRSSLGKAYQQETKSEFAGLELERAKRLDPGDPTAWLYSALLNQQRNRINQAIADLEHSRKLNDHRSLYRSRLLLNQDQAVRGANLARIYQDAAMEEVARREAIRAVGADYANYSAHLFLANSYNQLRDPNQINQRFETAWLSEFLMANLLAPVGANTLSQLVSQQEYSRLFEQDRFGLVLETGYTSNGDWTQSGAQYGRYGSIEYAVEASYQSRLGQRANNDLERTVVSIHAKLQLTPDDSVLVRAIYSDSESGDLTSVYDPGNPLLFDSEVRVKEQQEPIVLMGYHHTWNPGSHSLVLLGWLNDTVTVEAPTHSVRSLLVGGAGQVFGRRARPDVTGPRRYDSKFELLSVEGQHIWQTHVHTFVFGSRYQNGGVDTVSRQGPGLPALPMASVQDVHSNIERLTAYAYYSWQVLDPLILEAGVAYDRLTYPVNHRFAPITGNEATKDQLSPKLGVTWTPFEMTTLRAAYAKALGGVSFDQSVRLEPSQVAGFNQAWRSIIPESVVGAQAGSEFEVWGVEWDQRFSSRTYLGVKGEWLKSAVERELGEWWAPVFSLEPFGLREDLDYEEKTLQVTLNQLVGESWSFGGAYRLSQADLDREHPQLTPGAPSLTDEDTRSVLQQANLFALFQHSTGFLSRFDVLWSKQSNRGYSPARSGDDFWQFNAWVGYRFPRRRAEVRFGVLNLTDQDYRHNPLNLTAELPRDRTFTASLRLNF